MLLIWWHGRFIAGMGLLPRHRVEASSRLDIGANGFICFEAARACVGCIQGVQLEEFTERLHAVVSLLFI